MLSFRKAQAEDIALYFEWANDEAVRQNSINRSNIIWEDHVKWFTKKMTDVNVFMFLFFEQNSPVGQLRIEIDIDNNEAVIDYSVDKIARGRGLGKVILSEGYGLFLRLGKKYPLVGFVKKNNLASITTFLKAGYDKVAATIFIKDEEYVKFGKNA